MKRLQIYTGGHPRNADDLEHMQAGMVEAITSLAKGLLSNGATIPNCVLYGINVTSSSMGFTTYGAGAVIIDGEICQFDAQSIPDAIMSPHHYVLRTSDSYLAGNPVTYADASTKNVHLIRKAVIADIVVATAANEIEFDTRQQFVDVLKANMFNGDYSWITVGASPSYVNGFAAYAFPVDLRFCKLISGLCIIEGGMDFEGVASVANFVDIDISTPLVIFTLPDGWRPDEGCAYQEVSVEIPAGWVSFTVKVHDNGDVALVKAYNIGSGIVPGDFAGAQGVAKLSIHYRVAL